MGLVLQARGGAAGPCVVFHVCETNMFSNPAPSHACCPHHPWSFPARGWPPSLTLGSSHAEENREASWMYARRPHASLA